jgi:hypothetical protein
MANLHDQKRSAGKPPNPVPEDQGLIGELLDIYATQHARQGDSTGPRGSTQAQ